MKIERGVRLDPAMEHTPVNKDAPKAPVRFIRERGQTYFRVVRCPYCGGEHRHGGVDHHQIDPRTMLGGRVAHCDAETDHPFGLAEYRLIQITGHASRAELDEYFPMVDGATRLCPSRRGIPAALRHEVWLKSSGVCFYCGKQTTPFATFCVDHFVPVAHGGTNDLENLVPACRKCNGMKADLDIEDFRDRFPGHRFWFDGQGIG